MNQKILKNRLKLKQVCKKIQDDISHFGYVSAWGMDMVLEKDKIISFLRENDKKWLNENLDACEWNPRKINIF